jgi:hypothetical protein
MNVNIFNEQMPADNTRVNGYVNKWKNSESLPNITLPRYL